MSKLTFKTNKVTNDPFCSKEIIYPACINAERLMMLIKRPVLTIEEVKLLELLGFEIEWIVSKD